MAHFWRIVAVPQEELTQLDNVLVSRLDVQEPASIEGAVKEGIDRFGKIDVLVNNAGYGAFGVLEATPSESIRRQFDVNVLGLLDTTKALLPHFRSNKEGVIVNISSIGGKMTFPLGSLYHGTKFAVEGISESLSFETAAFGVKVKVVEPGAIKTDFISRSFDFNNDESLAEYQPTVESLMGAIGSMMENGSEPKVAAQVIYNAATDGTDQLRYTAGPDAEEIMASRQAADDATFFAGIKSQFGL